MCTGFRSQARVGPGGDPTLNSFPAVLQALGDLGAIVMMWWLMCSLLFLGYKYMLAGRPVDHAVQFCAGTLEAHHLSLPS